MRGRAAVRGRLARLKRQAFGDRDRCSALSTAKAAIRCPAHPPLCALAALGACATRVRALRAIGANDVARSLHTTTALASSLAREGKLAVASSAEPVGVASQPQAAFARLEVDSATGPMGSVVVESREVTVRLARAVDASRVAEIAPALRRLR